VAAITETFAASGWQSVGGGRHWAHPQRFGPAVFDTDEVALIEDGDRPDRAKPQRAQRCSCPLPFGRIEDLLCWKCARRVR
jgi:hypothetical protein